MKSKIKLSFIALCVICMANVSHARRAAPPQTVWAASSNGKFECKTETRTGQVTIYKTGDRKNPLWQVGITKFGTFFSKVILADSGNYLLHVKGNHQVHQLTDTAIEVLKKDGSSFKITANKFIDKLVLTQPRNSVQPKYQWLKKVETLTDQSITLINAIGQKKEVRFKDLKTKKP
jgi:hypothetical protein